MLLYVFNISEMSLYSTVSRSSLEPFVTECTEKCQQAHSNPRYNNSVNECDIDSLCKNLPSDVSFLKEL